MPDIITKFTPPPGEDFTVRADATCLYRVTHVESGTQVEFTVLAGQDFKIRSKQGSINIELLSFPSLGGGSKLEAV